MECLDLIFSTLPIQEKAELHFVNGKTITDNFNPSAKKLVFSNGWLKTTNISIKVRTQYIPKRAWKCYKIHKSCQVKQAKSVTVQKFKKRLQQIVITLQCGSIATTRLTNSTLQFCNSQVKLNQICKMDLNKSKPCQHFDNSEGDYRLIGGKSTYLSDITVEDQ